MNNKINDKTNVNFEENHNIKSIVTMNSYLKKVFNSFVSLYLTILDAHNEILKLQNELESIINNSNHNNLNNLDNIKLIDIHNKIINIMTNDMENILSQKIRGSNFSDTEIIFPVNYDKQYIEHRLELTYFLPDKSLSTKLIGSISNVSINKINDSVEILRSDKKYNFINLDTCSPLSNDDLNFHFKNVLNSTKELVLWFYNDIEFTKMAFRSLLDVIITSSKISNCTNEQKKWTNLINKIKITIDDVYDKMKSLNQ